jgi:hypothetical protein
MSLVGGSEKIRIFNVRGSEYTGGGRARDRSRDSDQKHVLDDASLCGCVTLARRYRRRAWRCRCRPRRLRPRIATTGHSRLCDWTPTLPAPAYTHTCHARSPRSATPSRRRSTRERARGPWRHAYRRRRRQQRGPRQREMKTQGFFLCFFFVCFFFVRFFVCFFVFFVCVFYCFVLFFCSFHFFIFDLVVFRLFQLSVCGSVGRRQAKDAANRPGPLPAKPEQRVSRQGAAAKRRCVDARATAASPLCAVCGVRCAVCGVRCAVCGVRCAVCGVRCACVNRCTLNEAS